MKRQPCNIPISQFRGKWPTQLLSLRTTAPCLPFEGRQHGALHRSPFPKRGKCPGMERSLFLRRVFFFQDSALWRLKCIHQRLLHILPPAQLPGQGGCLSREAESKGQPSVAFLMALVKSTDNSEPQFPYLQNRFIWILWGPRWPSLWLPTSLGPAFLASVATNTVMRAQRPSLLIPQPAELTYSHFWKQSIKRKREVRGFILHSFD